MLELEQSLQDRVDVAIQENPYLCGHDLQLETSAGRVVLEGVVDSFYQKQMAQEAIRRVDGVREIENHLQVEWH